MIQAQTLILEQNLHMEMGQFTKVPFLIGNRYQTLSGKAILITDASTQRGYETILGDDGIWRYNRQQDMGRVTGSPHDFSCQDNLVPLYMKNTEEAA